METITKKFFLEIISPASANNFMVHWVEVETPSGSFLIGPDHSPLISILKQQSSITYKNDQMEIVSQEIQGGILEIHEKGTIIILEQ